MRDNLYSAQQSAQLARSPHEREIYDAAARSYAAKVETLGAIDVGIRVALAKLEHIRASLAVVPPRIVKLSATSTDMGDTSYVRLSEDLRAASNELQEAEERFQMLALGGPDDPCAEPRPAARRSEGVRVAVMPAEAGEDPPELEEPSRSALRAARHAVI